MRLLNAIRSFWRSWRTRRHTLAYRRHMQRTLALRGGRQT